jgi:hypothetical protein
MADTIKGGLGFADPSKLNQYGAKEEDISEYQQSLQDSINALQMRYAQPNWFNVAAGFFKPQLGGFAASLGSASEALGQNVEKQRESQLPIAQMRSQLALSKITMGQNKTAADMESARLLKGEALSPQYVSKLVNLAPNSAQAKAAQAELLAMQESQKLEASEASVRSTQYSNALTRLREQNAAGGFATPEAYAAALATAEAAYGPLTANKLRKPNEAVGGVGGAGAVSTDAAAAAAAAVAAKLPEAAAAAAEKAPDAAAVAADAAAKAKLTLLPNGARVGPDGLALFQAGIPIISQFRTKEDQEKLKQDGGYQDKKGNWFTKAGRLIAEDSKHFTGDALDLESTATLTDEQKKLLAAQGFKQGSGKESNHWSRTPSAAAAVVSAAPPAPAAPADSAAAAAAARAKIESIPITVSNTLRKYPATYNQVQKGAIDQENEIIKANATKAEAAPYDSYLQSQLLLQPGLQTGAKDTFAKLDDFTLKHQPEIAQMSNLLREKGGFAGALAQKGVGVSIMGYGANFNVDVLSALKNSLPKNLWSTFDDYTALLGKGVYYGLLGSGIDPNKMTEKDLTGAVRGYLASNIDIDKTPVAQYAGIKNAQLNFEHRANVAEAWKKQFQRAIDAGSLSPAADSVKHPALLAEEEVHRARLEKERQRIAKLYGGGK